MAIRSIFLQSVCINADFYLWTMLILSPDIPLGGRIQPKPAIASHQHTMQSYVDSTYDRMTIHILPWLLDSEIDHPCTRGSRNPRLWSVYQIAKHLWFVLLQALVTP